MATAPRGPAGLETRSPDPRRYDSWQDYALALGAWQDRQRMVSMGVQPEAVMLLSSQTVGPPTAHNRPPGLARATADGLLVYDPALKRVRLSCNHAWFSLGIEGTPP
jgi:hypothetical protein